MKRLRTQDDALEQLKDQPFKSRIESENVCICSFLTNIKRFVPTSFIFNANSTCSHFYDYNPMGGVFYLLLLKTLYFVGIQHDCLESKEEVFRGVVFSPSSPSIDHPYFKS